MKAIANVLTGLVALSHLGFLVLEMFFCDHPVGRRIFGMTPEVSCSRKHYQPRWRWVWSSLPRGAAADDGRSPMFPSQQGTR